MSKDKNEKVKYNILFVPDSENVDAKKISVKQEWMLVFFAAIVFLVIAALAYSFILTEKMEASLKTIADLNTQINVLTEENTRIMTENKELNDKVSILSDTVNEKVQKEEEVALTYIPSGFPLEGKATYNEEETQLDGNAILVFQGTTGAKVSATGSGTILSIVTDANSGYIITIDHENGYLSVYRNGSEPKVREGDSVTGNTTLFEIEQDKEELGYQIIKDNVYINPLEIMEIHG